MTAVLVLNGRPPAPERLRALSALHPVYAADGGSLACLHAGVTPRWVVGDFDSVHPRDLPAEWDCRHIPDQDSTDFEKLLRSLPEDATDLRILGAFGDRLDHLLTNLLIADALPPGIRVCLEGDAQELSRVTPLYPYMETRPRGSTLSLLPLSIARGVSTRGLRWNVQNADMGAHLQWGQSNVVEGPVEIRVSGGSLFVWTEGHVF